MPARARSLAEDLRGRSDEQLLQLFRRRPILLRPVPKSFADLALRANAGAATVSALDDLTATELDVLEAACALTPAGRFGVADLAAGLDVDADVIEPVVAELYARVLLWGGMDDLRVPSAVREALGPDAGGLDPVVRENLSGVRLALADPAAFLDRVTLAPPEARVLLQQAAWGPATIAAAAGTEWLAQQDFMAADELGNPVVPREVALILRRGQLLAEPRLQSPELSPIDATQAQAVDERVGHTADQVLRLIDRVLSRLELAPLGRQGNGAFPARDWDRLLTAVGAPPGDVALVLQLAWQLEWVDWDNETRLRPTTVYGSADTDDRAMRWGEVVATWLSSTRPAPPDPAKALAVAEDPNVAVTRALVLRGLIAGARADVTAWLRWFRPRRTIPANDVSTTMAEAETLGLTLGGVPGAALRAKARSASELAEIIAPLLPPVSDRIIVQADLTATALGPLDPQVERRLSLIADWESGGAATVFRFTPDSVRAALARGESPADVTAWLTGISATPLPQALTVLIQDQAVALPTTTVHEAGAVIRCEPGEAAALLADPALAELGLQQIADGVLLSRVGADETARTLLGSGRAAARPGAGVGPLNPSRPTGHRSGAAPSAARVVASLRQLEQRDRAAPQPPGRLPPAGPAEIIAVLQNAVLEHQKVWLSFAGPTGDRMTHLIEPLQLESGDVCAFDVTAGEIRTIPLERVVASALA